MLKLLLDEHISAQIASQLRPHHPTIGVVNVHEWRGGRLLSVADEVVLAAAHEEHFTLVTYDQQTIRPLVAMLASEGKSHSGVLFTSSKTVASNNFGALVRALLALWEEAHEYDWTNVVRYLQA